MGIQWRRAPGFQRKEDPGSRRRRKEAVYPSSEEVGDFEKRGWGLEESAAAFSIHLDAWPLPDLQGRGTDALSLWRAIPTERMELFMAGPCAWRAVRLLWPWAKP